MRTDYFAIALVFALSPHVAAASNPDTPASRMFGRMTQLIGDWEGTYEWSGARTGSGTLRASYSLTGNGSAVIETLIMGGQPMMTSVYHLDGNDLRVTHYCAARNQPRLKADSIQEPEGLMRFAFLDVTNVTAPQQGYVEALTLQLRAAEEVQITFTFGGGAPRAIEHITLRRVRRVSATDGSVEDRPRSAP